MLINKYIKDLYTFATFGLVFIVKQDLGGSIKVWYTWLVHKMTQYVLSYNLYSILTLFENVL